MVHDPYQPPRAPLEVVPSTAPNAPTNPHVLSRQLLGFVFWVVLLGLGTGELAVAAIGLVVGGVTFADAWRSGIYKRPDSKSLLNISPMGWAIVMALLLIVAYPAYLASRNKLRTIQGGNAFFVATIVVGGLIIGLFALSLGAAFLR